MACQIDGTSACHCLRTNVIAVASIFVMMTPIIATRAGHVGPPSNNVIALIETRNQHIFAARVW